MADIGCGTGAATMAMADAFPYSDFRGFDPNPTAIEQARANAAFRARFDVATAQDFPGRDYALITTFDCLHDEHDPVAAARHIREALAPDGRWLIVEPLAGDGVEDNLTPVGRVYYALSTLVCMQAPTAHALGAQAGEARLRDVVVAAGFTHFAPRRRHPVQRRPGGPAVTMIAGAREQSRARYPDQEGYVERDGVKLFYEVYGDGEDTILLLPTWSIIHSRHWKAQIPYLVAPLPRRHVRRPRERQVGPPARRRAVHRGRVRRRRARRDGRDGHRRRRSSSASRAARCGARSLAADHPERVQGDRLHRPGRPARPGPPERAITSRFEEELDTDEGWAKYNRHYWLRDYLGFLEYFFAQMFNEPHSTKQIEDCVGWGLETDPETLADTTAALSLCGTERFADIAARVRCPVLVIHGDKDRIRPHAQGAALAQATGGELVTLEGSGHGPQARDPVKVNLLLREFAERGSRARALQTWTRGRRRRRRALFISSPIGLGHARRDVAIAQELRAAPARPRDRLAGAEPGHAGAGGRGRARPPGERAAGQRVRPHRVRVGRARPALLPGLAPDGRDPGRELHGLRRPRARASTTTSGSATRPGSSTTTCTRTRSSSAPPTCG